MIFLFVKLIKYLEFHLEYFKWFFRGGVDTVEWVNTWRAIKKNTSSYQYINTCRDAIFFFCSYSSFFLFHFLLINVNLVLVAENFSALHVFVFCDLFIYIGLLFQYSGSFTCNILHNNFHFDIIVLYLHTSFIVCTLYSNL